MSRTALIIGSGIGGLSLGIRLQSLGFATTILERLSAPGGRARVLRTHGFTFDMGPTVITVPHFIEELFALERGAPALDAPDFPPHVLGPKARVTAGVSSGPATSRYCTLVPLTPFYRITFDDGTWFDYDGDEASARRQIAAIEPEDLAGFERFQAEASAIFRRGFLELGMTYFGDPWTLMKAVPDLLKLGAVRNLFSFTSRAFKSPKLRQVFSFETLLVGGNPMQVPAIYAMIHLVERTWGVHFVKGGTGALVDGLVRKFEALGGQLRFQAPVASIDVHDGHGGSPGWLGPRVARGVTLEDGTVLHADLVASNADAANTYLKLLDARHRRRMPDWRVKALRQSNSVVVVYFGFKDDPQRPLQLKHHTIILGPRYEALLKAIFHERVLSPDFSLYLHVPTITDASLAPPGHHAAYALVPVPNNLSGIDWASAGPALVERVLTFLDERGHIPGLRERLVYQSHITPDTFEHTLDAASGNAFGPEPTLLQSAYFRPHNRCEDVSHLYLVGAGTQPGGGTPSVMMSAKMTARQVAIDFGLTAKSAA